VRERLAGAESGKSGRLAFGKATLKQVVGPIDAAHLRQAHALVESGKAIGKVVLAGWPAG
jgi:hypothetical protein